MDDEYGMGMDDGANEDDDPFAARLMSFEVSNGKVVLN